MAQHISLEVIEVISQVKLFFTFLRVVWVVKLGKVGLFVFFSYFIERFNLFSRDLLCHLCQSLSLLKRQDQITLNGAFDPKVFFS